MGHFWDSSAVKNGEPSEKLQSDTLTVSSRPGISDRVSEVLK